MYNYKQLSLHFESLVRGNRQRKAVPIDEDLEKLRQKKIVHSLFVLND